MILIDSSAWVELFRKTGSATHRAVRRVMASDEKIAITDPVAMELLAGARNTRDLETLEDLVMSLEPMPVFGLSDYENAAAVYRSCRWRGFTPRSQIDCLIAAVALREDVALLHNDRDFDLIAAHTGLKIA